MRIDKYSHRRAMKIIGPFLLLLTLASTSCRETEYTEDQFGRDFLKLLIEGDTAALKGYYLQVADSSQLIDSSGFIYINLWREDPSSFISEEYKVRRFLEWRQSAIDMNVLSNASYLRTEVDTPTWSVGNSKPWNGYPFFKVYFLSDTVEYFFYVNPVFKIKNGWKINGLSTITTDEMERISEENTPFVPRKMNFIKYGWTANSDCKSFDKFYVTLSNNHSSHFDYIKYRLSILDSNGETLFSKTLEIHDKVFSGDILNINVPTLKGYYLGTNVCNEDFIVSQIEILDARPKAFDY